MAKQLSDFEKAFAEHRKKFGGAGGIFTFNGKQYTTEYKEEQQKRLASGGKDYLSFYAKTPPAHKTDSTGATAVGSDQAKSQTGVTSTDSPGFRAVPQPTPPLARQDTTSGGRESGGIDIDAITSGSGGAEKGGIGEVVGKGLAIAAAGAVGYGMLKGAGTLAKKAMGRGASLYTAKPKVAPPVQDVTRAGSEGAPAREPTIEMTESPEQAKVNIAMRGSMQKGFGASPASSPTTVDSSVSEAMKESLSAGRRVHTNVQENPAPTAATTQPTPPVRRLSDELADLGKNPQEPTPPAPKGESPVTAQPSETITQTAKKAGAAKVGKAKATPQVGQPIATKPAEAAPSGKGPDVVVPKTTAASELAELSAATERVTAAKPTPASAAASLDDLVRTAKVRKSIAAETAAKTTAIPEARAAQGIETLGAKEGSPAARDIEQSLAAAPSKAEAAARTRTAIAEFQKAGGTVTKVLPMEGPTTEAPPAYPRAKPFIIPSTRVPQGWEVSGGRPSFESMLSPIEMREKAAGTSEPPEGGPPAGGKTAGSLSHDELNPGAESPNTIEDVVKVPKTTGPSQIRPSASEALSKLSEGVEGAGEAVGEAAEHVSRMSKLTATAGRLGKLAETSGKTLGIAGFALPIIHSILTFPEVQKAQKEGRPMSITPFGELEPVKGPQI